MKFETVVVDIGYPLYCTNFIGENTILVGGGGGEGDNGIPNKLTSVVLSEINGLNLKIKDEYDVGNNDDSPTAMDANMDVILLGCNENSKKIEQTKENNHLRQFTFNSSGEITFVKTANIYDVEDVNDYIKIIVLSKDSTVAAVASSKLPTTVKILDIGTLSVRYEVDIRHELKDMDFSPNGKLFAYITKSSLEIVSPVTGSTIVRKTDFSKDIILSKFKFLRDDIIIIVGSSKESKGLYALKILLKNGTPTLLKQKSLSKNVKNIVSMDISNERDIAVLATNNNSIILLNLESLFIIYTFKEIHNFVITDIVISPNSDYIASVSVANTLHLIKVPKNISKVRISMKEASQLFTRVLLLILFAYLLYVLYQKNSHGFFKGLILQGKKAIEPNLTYFTMNSCE